MTRAVSGLDQEETRGAISLARIFFGRLANLMRARSAARRQEWRRLQFEPLEPRFLLSADLVGSVHFDAGAALLPGDREHATVVVQNVGDAATRGRVSLQLYASADGVLDASDTLLDTGKIAGRLAAGASKSAKLSFDVPDGLPPGSYSLLAVVDPADKVHESNEANNVAVGPQFDVAWMFGNVPGHGREPLLLRDADGTRVLFALSGSGTGQITVEDGQWDLGLTGTDGRSVLTVLTLGGGDRRVALDDVHVSGGLGAVLAPTMDLTGTLALGGPLTAGLLLGSATDAIIAAPTIKGASFFGLSVKGIAILGDVEDSQILIGADLGADGQPGGSGANADSYSAGNLGHLLIGGSMSGSSVRVGQDPVDGVFDNGDDLLLGGSIRSITILDEMSSDSEFVASAFPAFARIDGHRVDTSSDPRFIHELGDHVAPTVTIDQGPAQGDPTTASPIVFDVHFSELVTGFTASDVDFAGSTVGGTLAAAVSGSGADYTVSVTGMDGVGTVVASIDAGAANDSAGNASLASTSMDNAVTFEPMNTPPVAGADSASTDEDVALTLSAASLLANDTDVDGDTLTIASFTQATHGAVGDNGDGTYTYTPNLNFNGLDGFSYTVADGAGGTATATVAITVNAVNDAPVAGADSASTDEDVALTLSAASLLANDTDVDGDTLTIASFTQATHGAVGDNGDGTYTYTPNLNFNGLDGFSYTVADGAGGTATATVAITVNAVNDAPVAVDQTFSGLEDTTLTGFLTASDVDGDALAYSVVTGPSHGLFAFSNFATGQFVYVPDANSNGTDSLTFRASDGAAQSNVATVTFEIAPVNDAPVAAVDAYSTGEGVRLDVPALSGVLVNDSDVDGDALTAILLSSSNPTAGSVTLDSDGALHFVPAADFSGKLTLAYVANDGAADSNLATVSLTVNAVNDAPVAGDDSFSTAEDVALTISAADLLANDTDVDGDTVTIASFTQAGHGTVVDHADGTYSYTPALNFNGADSFSYTISDGQGGTDSATVSLTVNAVNDAPVAGDDSFSTAEDVALTISAADLLANDTDVDGDTVTIASFTQAGHGTVVDHADGTYSYTPALNFNGADSFSYTISDGQGGTDSATVSLTVNAVNDAPVAGDDSFSTAEDVALTISAADLLANDTDVDGDTVTIASFTQAGHGTVVDHADGTYSYTPALNFNGADSFSYTISDGQGGTDSATVSLTVNAVNDAPVAGDDSFSTAEDVALTISAADLLANDTDVDGDTVTIASFTQAGHGTVVDHADGTYSYTPALNFNGADSFSYTISDGQGGTDSATVSLTVNAVNDAPVAGDDSFSTAEDVALTISAADLLANDTDVDGDTVTIASFTQAGHGTVVDHADGTYSYTPALNFNGADSFSYTISDGQGGTDSATVSLTVNAVNDAPVAGDDSFSTAEDVALTISAADLLANDTDVDGDTVTIASFTQAGHGTVVDHADGTYSYTPALNFNGADSFSYTISDGQGGTDSATVSLTVNAVNDAPVAGDDSFSTAEDVALTISAADLLANDTDVDGDTVTIASFTQAGHGTVVDHADGTYSYTPALNFNGADSFSYTISDGQGGTDSATVSLTVNAVNDAPVAGDDSFSTAEDVALTISAADLLANDTDVDGDTVTIASFTQAGHGTVVDHADGTYSYTPALNFNGADSFSYTISDGQGGTDSATVSLTVNAVNDAPVAGDDSFSTAEDVALTISAADLLANDTDVDGDTVTIASFTQAGHGTVVDHADGTYSYTPALNFNGADSFSYTISDGQGGTDSATVSLTVNAVNDAPVAGADSFSTAEDVALTISAADLLANDTDVDGDTVTIASFTQAGHGTVVDHADGTYSYTPALNFNGADSFSYTISDGQGGTDSATVSLTVNAVNDAPVAGADSFSTAEDVALTISAADLLANDTDVDGDTVTIASFTQAGHGTVVDHADGTYSYTPALNFNGADSFSYTISDGQGGTDSATVSLTVNAVNDAPVLSPIPDKITLVNRLLSVQASAADVDTPASGLTFSLVGTVPTGAAITAAGLFTWTPTAFGTSPITVRVTDDGSLSDEKTFSVNVVAPPLMAIDDAMVVEGNSGTTDAVFRVLLSGPAPEQGVSVNYANSGTFGATPGSDFTAVSGTLTFAPGETEKTFAVPIIGNTTAESDEIFQYALSSPVNAVLSTKSLGTGTILDNDDGATHIGIDRRTVFEGDSGNTDAVFNVLLSNASASTVTVDYAAQTGGAIVGSDFAATSGTLTFAPGATQQAIHVPIIGDATVEGDESFTVRLTNPVNATISAFAVANNGTIVNDDGPGLMLASSVASDPISGSTLDAAQLEATLNAAMMLWTQALGAGDPRLALLDNVTIDTANFAGAQIGGTWGSAIYIDTDAAGHGWFVDLTPANSNEFALHLGGGALAAAPSSAAFGRMDLLTVVTHELGHVLGIEDAARYPVMQLQLDPGTRYALAAPKFDFDALDARGPRATIAWDEAAVDWHLHRGPHAAPFERPGAGKVPEFFRL